MTTYDLIPATDYDNRTVRGNLDLPVSESFNVRNLTTGSYSIDGEIVLLCDASGGNVIVNLPTIASAPRRFYLIKKTNLTNLVTITATGGNTIGGSFTYDISSAITIEIINNGSGNDWTILSNVGAVTPVDSGVATREFLAVNGAAQNPSILVTNTEVRISGVSTGTLANGSLGQLKRILIVDIITPGHTYTISPTTFVGATTIRFDTIGQSINLVYTVLGWCLNGGSGAIIL
jgi:hypothetical protein